MNSTVDVQAIASKELYSQLEVQTVTRAIPLADPMAARIRANNYWRVRETILGGELYWQQKQSFKKLREFKVWLADQGFCWNTACKLIKLYETFAGFPIDQIAWVSVDNLYVLAQPRHKELLEELRSQSQWTDTLVQQAVKLFRGTKKAKESKPKIEEPGSGWRRAPGGGRAYQMPLLHDDWIGTLIERIREIKNQTLSHIIGEMALLFVNSGKVPGITLKGIDIPRSARSTSNIPAGYIDNARGNAQCASNARFLAHHRSLA